jgi:hypothetical protein
MNKDGKDIFEKEKKKRLYLSNCKRGVKIISPFGINPEL